MLKRCRWSCWCCRWWRWMLLLLLSKQLTWGLYWWQCSCTFLLAICETVVVVVVVVVVEWWWWWWWWWRWRWWQWLRWQLTYRTLLSSLTSLTAYIISSQRLCCGQMSIDVDILSNDYVIGITKPLGISHDFIGLVHRSQHRQHRLHYSWYWSVKSFALHNINMKIELSSQHVSDYIFVRWQMMNWQATDNDIGYFLVWSMWTTATMSSLNYRCKLGADCWTISE